LNFGNVPVFKPRKKSFRHSICINKLFVQLTYKLLLNPFAQDAV